MTGDMNNNSASVYKDFLAVVMFRKNPQDLASSSPLLNLALCLYACVSLVYTSTYTGLDNAIRVVVIDFILLLSLVYFWLAMFRLNNRWRQTIIAIAGGNSILGIIAIPVSFILSHSDAYPAIQIICSYIMFFLFVWTIALFAHIFRHAFSTPLIMGVFIAIIYNILVFSVISSLVPEINTQ